MNDYPAYDLASAVDRLGPRAGAKYRGLCGQLDEVVTLLKLTLDQQKDLDIRRAVVFSHLSSRDTRLPENDASIRRLQQQEQQLDAEGAALDAKRSRLNATRANLDQVLSHLRNAMLSVYRSPPAHPVVVWPRPGESLADAIERVRAEIGSKQSELVAIQSAPWPASEQRQWLAAEIARLRADGPRLEIGSGGRPQLTSPDVMQYAATGTAFTAPSGSVLKMMASLFPDRLTEFLRAQIVDAPGAIFAGADRRRARRDPVCRAAGACGRNGTGNLATRTRRGIVDRGGTGTEPRGAQASERVAVCDLGSCRFD